MKTTRIISTHKLGGSTVSLLSAYCHLLNNKLEDKWAFHHADDAMAEIVFVPNDYTGAILKQAQHIIRVGNHKRLSQYVASASEHILCLPIESVQLVKILNNISKLLEDNNNPVEISTKSKFSIKRILSSFIFGSSKVKKPVLNNASTPVKATPLTDKLLNMSDPTFFKNLKVVFLGRPGAGKTTAIVSAQTKNLVICDVNTTDSLGLLKDQTTIGIDYCDCNYISGIRLKLFGTPGQGRYSYLQLQTVNRADIYVILVDLTSVAPFSEFQYYNNILKSPEANHNAIKLVAFTHYDLREHDVLNLSQTIKRECGGRVVTAILDPRDRKQVRNLLEEIAQLSLGQTPTSSVYNNIKKVINLN